MMKSPHINIFFSCIIFLLAMATLNSLYAKTVIKTTGNVDVNIETKTLTSIGLFSIASPNGVTISANKIEVLYENLINLKDNFTNQKLNNLKKITAEESLVITTKTGILKGDKYIYDVQKGIMIITSNNGPTTYKDDNFYVEAYERFEYQEKPNIVVLRGNPTITFNNKNKEENSQVFNASLIYGKLNDSRNDIEYIEAFDNIKITNTDGTNISGNYAYYYAKTGLLIIENNLKITSPSGTLKGCQVIVDTISGTSKIVPCANTKGISGVVTKN